MKILKIYIMLLLLVSVGIMAQAQQSAFQGTWNAEYDPNYNYRVTGQFATWGSNYEEKFMMTPVDKSDARLNPIKSQLNDAQYIYIYEYKPSQYSNAEWSVKYSGPKININGIYAIKIIRLEKDPTEPSGWMFDMWIPSAEAGGLKNLSPDTLFTPKNRSDIERDAAKDGYGSNNDNPVLLKGPVSYYVVFAIFKDKSRGMGAVIK